MSGSIFSSMQISAAAMTAQRTRMDTVSENIANAESTRTSEGGPYQRRQVVFASTPADKKDFNSIFNAAAGGHQPATVKVADVILDKKPFREVYDPSHPDADANGIVKYPNVNPIEEMVDMQSAARSFEANVTALETSKRMFMKSLELLR